MLHGGYTQTMTLIRTVYEDWLTSMDCKKHDDTVRGILYGETSVLSPSQMVDRFDEPLRSELKKSFRDEGTYGFLSTFAHPRFRALGVLVNPQTKTLRLVPEYDVSLFLASAHFLLNVGVNMAEFLAAIGDPGWVQDNLELVMKEVTHCSDELIEQAKSLAD